MFRSGWLGISLYVYGRGFNCCEQEYTLALPLSLCITITLSSLTLYHFLTQPPIHVTICASAFLYICPYLAFDGGCDAHTESNKNLVVSS